MGEIVELILLLISSGIPGFYTYYALSNKNSIYYDSDNKNIILSFFSIISILISILILSLFSGENNVNELFSSLTFTKIILSLVASIILIIILTEFVYPVLFNLYDAYLNFDRSKHNLTRANTLPIHLKRYENESYQIYIEIKDFNDTSIENGIIKFYSKKSDRNLVLEPIDDEYKIPIKSECRQEKFIDFENRIIIYYFFF